MCRFPHSAAAKPKKRQHRPARQCCSYGCRNISDDRGKADSKRSVHDQCDKSKVKRSFCVSARKVKRLQNFLHNERRKAQPVNRDGYCSRCGIGRSKGATLEQRGNQCVWDDQKRDGRRD
jgi:hypothetical protein